MIELEDINILDWHGERFLPYIPEHFKSVILEDSVDRTHLLAWLDSHTRGRIGIVKVTEPNGNNGRLAFVSDPMRIGFEDHEEATMYAMFYR